MGLTYLLEKKVKMKSEKTRIEILGGEEEKQLEGNDVRPRAMTDGTGLFTFLIGCNESIESRQSISQNL